MSLPSSTLRRELGGERKAAGVGPSQRLPKGTSTRDAPWPWPWTGAYPAGLERSERAGGSGAALSRPHPAPWLPGWATAGKPGVVLRQQVRPKARGLLPPGSLGSGNSLWVSQPLHNTKKVAGQRGDLRGRAALPGRRASGAQPQLRSPRRDAAPASGDRALQRLCGSSRPPPISRSPGGCVLPVARCAPLCSSSYWVPRQKLPLCPSPRRFGLRNDRHRPPPTTPKALVRVQRQMSRWLTCQAATVRSRSVDHVRGLLSLKPQTWPAETLAKTEQQEAALWASPFNPIPLRKQKG